MGIRMCVVAVAGCLLAHGIAGAQPNPNGSRHLYTIYGLAPGDHYGLAGGALGDVDADGVPDFLIANAYDDRVATDQGSVDVLSGATGRLIRTVDGTVSGGVFGWSVHGIGDVDNDTFPDFVAGGRFSNNAIVFSGRTGAVIHTKSGALATDHFGVFVSRAGDVNNDGTGDFIVGAPQDIGAGSAVGYATVYSGKDGTTLHTFVGDSPGDRFGTSVSDAGDLDNDGHGDIAVGASQFQAGNGYLRMFSGKTGSTIRTIPGVGFADRFGSYTRLVGDVDNDLVPDLAVGAPGHTRTPIDGAGLVRVVSGKDGSTIHDFVGQTTLDALGASVGEAGDVDGDGHADILAGATQIIPRTLGYATLYSGKTGQVLFTFQGTNAYALAGWAAETVGDITGDGAPDFLVGVPHDQTRGLNVGMTRVFSAVPELFSSDTHEVPVGAGGAQGLYVDGGPGEAGMSYVIGGSAAGTSPGFQVQSFRVPLNFDTYLLLTINAPTVPPLSGFSGLLDAAGQGAGAFTLPPTAFAALAGLTIHHAAVIVGPSGIRGASRALPLRFIP